jgi:hypothetical protein
MYEHTQVWIKAENESFEGFLCEYSVHQPFVGLVFFVVSSESDNNRQLNRLNNLYLATTFTTTSTGSDVSVQLRDTRSR